MTPYEQGFRDAIAAAAKTAKTSNFEDGPRGTIEGQIAEAISALSPEDDPGDPAFYRSAQTGVEPALPPTCETCSGFGNLDFEDSGGRRLVPCPDCIGRDGKGRGRARSNV